MNWEKHAAHIEEVLGYHFRDPALLRQAFTRESYCNEARQRGDAAIESNEVLEFCGDSVLGTAIVSILMERMGRRTAHGLSTTLREGDFTVIKSHLTNKSMLGAQMERIGLAPYLIVGRGDTEKQIWREPSVREDLFESIIGAIWFDCGGDMQTVIRIIRPLLDVDAYLTERAREKPAKSALQEWCDAPARAGTTHAYETLSESGPDHDKTFLCRCTVRLKSGECISGEGTGRNRKRAEAEAAACVLALLKSRS